MELAVVDGEQIRDLQPYANNTAKWALGCEPVTQYTPDVSDIRVAVVRLNGYSLDQSCRPKARQGSLHDGNER